MIHATEQDDFVRCQIGYQLDAQQDAGDVRLTGSNTVPPRETSENPVFVAIFFDFHCVISSTDKTVLPLSSNGIS